MPGPADSCLKRIRAEDLLEGIRVVAGGEALLSPSVTRRLMQEFARTTSAIGPRADVRDLDVLTLMTGQP